MSSISPVSRPAVLMMTIMLLLGPILYGMPGTDARITKELSNGAKEKDLEFFNGDEEYDLTILVPNVASLESAHIGVTGLSLGSVLQHPDEPAIDVGNDNSTDWMFSGPGYGTLGRQRVLLDNATSGEISFSGQGSDSSLTLRMPSGAKVTTASIRVAGEAHGTGWWNDSWLSRIPVTVTENKGVNLGEALVDIWIDTHNFTVRNTDEFRVTYKDGASEVEMPVQTIDERKVSGHIMEARVVFKTAPLAPGARRAAATAADRPPTDSVAFGRIRPVARR